MGILEIEEREADVLLLNIEFGAMRDHWIPYLHLLQEMAMVVSEEDVLGAYRMMKALYSIRPGLRLGLIEYGESRGEPRHAAKSLTRASNKFLQKSPLTLGDVQMDAAIRPPLVGVDLCFENPPNRTLIEIGRKIIQGLNRRAGQRPFFAQVQAPTRHRSESL